MVYDGMFMFINTMISQRHTYKFRNEWNRFSSWPDVRHAVNVAVERIVIRIVHPPHAIWAGSTVL